MSTSSSAAFPISLLVPAKDEKVIIVKFDDRRPFLDIPGFSLHKTRKCVSRKHFNRNDNKPKSYKLFVAQSLVILGTQIVQSFQENSEDFKNLKKQKVSKELFIKKIHRVKHHAP